MKRDKGAPAGGRSGFGPPIDERTMAHSLLREWDGVSAEDTNKLSVIQEQLSADDPAFGEQFTPSARRGRAGSLVADGTVGVGIVVVATGGVGVWRPLLAFPVCALGAIALVARVAEQRRGRRCDKPFGERASRYEPELLLEELDRATRLRRPAASEHEMSLPAGLVGVDGSPDSSLDAELAQEEDPGPEQQALRFGDLPEEE